MKFKEDEENHKKWKQQERNYRTRDSTANPYKTLSVIRALLDKLAVV
jgi:hypothetical protein